MTGTDEAFSEERRTFGYKEGRWAKEANNW
jgi:hypothetical protein